MSAFNFPDPVDQQTVTNPITGSTYQWKEPPGKWVLTHTPDLGSSIWSEDAPEGSFPEGTLWIKSTTLQLYVFDGIYWVEVDTIGGEIGGGGGGGGASVDVGPDAPIADTPGQLWVKDTTNEMFFYNGTYWISLTAFAA